MLKGVHRKVYVELAIRRVWVDVQMSEIGVDARNPDISIGQRKGMAAIGIGDANGIGAILVDGEGLAGGTGNN